MALLLVCQSIVDNMAPTKTIGDKYHIFSKQICSGNQGTVYPGLRIADHKPVAVKILQKFDWCPCNSCCGKKPREICYLEKCQGISGVIKLYDYDINDHRILIFMERPCQSSDLYELISSLGHFTENAAKTYFQQLVRCTQIMHQIGVVHSDLKVENVLVDLEEKEAKIIDFGNAHSTSQTPARMVATPEACPPEEYVVYGQYDAEAVAVWCLGLILYEMVHGQFAFIDRNDVINRDLGISRRISESLKDLLRKMLSKHPSDRPKLAEILQHRWVMETDV